MDDVKKDLEKDLEVGYGADPDIYETEEQELECHYGFEYCLDAFLRDYCGCVGCPVITPSLFDQSLEGGEAA